jgi:hypothetical protein
MANEFSVQSSADIVFLVDVTGSMKPCIDELKKSLASFFANISTGNALDWQGCVIGYRDLEADDPKYHYVGKDSPFVKTSVDIQKQVDTLLPRGGGISQSEEPESGLDALCEAMFRPGWRTKGKVHRIIVVLTDAPTKPKTSPLTWTPKGQPMGVHELAQEVAQYHFKLQIYAPKSAEWDLLGHAPGSFLSDISRDQTKDKYEGLKQIDWKEVYTTLMKTATDADALPAIPLPQAPPGPLPPQPTPPAPTQPTPQPAPSNPAPQQTPSPTSQPAPSPQPGPQPPSGPEPFGPKTKV